MEDVLNIKVDPKDRRHFLVFAYDTLKYESDYFKLPEWASPEIMDELKEFRTFTSTLFYSTSKLQRFRSGIFNQ